MAVIIAVHTEATRQGLRELSHRMRAALDAGEMAAGLAIEQQIKTLLSTSAHPPGTPTPSAPGSPPAVVTGTLRRSITTERRPGAGGVYVSVGPTAVYGRIQELGGRAGRGSTLPARPYVAPARAVALESARRVMVAAVARAIGI